MKNNTVPHNIWVCITAVGDKHYHEVAQIAVRSVLQHSSFSVFLGIDCKEPPLWAEHPRIRLLPLVDKVSNTPAFFNKFDTLEKLVQEQPDASILQLDADAMFIREISPGMVVDALGEYGFAMVAQESIQESDNDRAFFLNHYIEHPMMWFEATQEPPNIESFRYFNSGVVLATSAAMAEFLQWSREMLYSKPAAHQLGQHRVLDQDYFQYWLNTLHPGRCKTLNWEWNHCEHWHDVFPESGALICHFSNFCDGPDARTSERMMKLMHGIK